VTPIVVTERYPCQFRGMLILPSPQGIIQEVRQNQADPNYTIIISKEGEKDA